MQQTFANPENVITATEEPIVIKGVVSFDTTLHSVRGKLAKAELGKIFGWLGMLTIVEIGTCGLRYNQRMFKISDFAKLAQVSTHTLRYYDKVGLLTPHQVDSFTGYRYYTVQQLASLNRILALRDLGFSLEQIQDMLTLPADDMQAILNQQKAHLKEEIKREQARLQRVVARLNLLQQNQPLQDVVVKSIDAVSYFSTGRIFARDEEIASYARQLYNALHALHTDGIAIGVLYAPSTVDQHHHLEIGFPTVTTPHEFVTLTNGRRMYQRELPAIQKAATLIYEGPRIESQRGYAALFTWMEANNCQPDGYFRERYLQPAATATDPHNIMEFIVPLTFV